MPKPRSVPLRQLDELIRLMEVHREIAVGRLLGGALAHQQTSRTWANIAESLNSMANGCTKTSEQWKAYWHELKYRARKRAREVRLHASGTGGGPGRRPLTDIENRILGILGPISYEGNPSVRIPVNVPEDIVQNPPPDGVPEIPVEERPFEERPVQERPNPERPPPDLEDNSSTDSNPTVRRGIQAGSSRQRQDRPRQYRQISADPPRWARDYEERRLAIDERRAQTQVRMVEMLEKIDEVLRRISAQLE